LDKMKNKKGSHIEFVLSFLIFVSAIVFIYVIVGSLIPKEFSEKNVLDSLSENILDELNSETLVLRVNSVGSCVQIVKPEFSEEGFVLATDDSGLVDSFVDENYIYSAGTGFIKIYYSDAIEESDSFAVDECDLVLLDSVRNEKNFFEKSIIDLMNNFSEDSDGLKTRLDVPSGINFDLYFEYEEGVSLGFERDVNAGIYSRDLHLFYVSVEGIEKEGLLRVRVWR